MFGSSPGCACDVPSNLYSFSFELNPDWSRLWSSQPEIQAYIEKCAHKYGIFPHIKFNRTVTGGEWLQDYNLWKIKCSNGDIYYTQLLINGAGILSDAKPPSIPGSDLFKVKYFIHHGGIISMI